MAAATDILLERFEVIACSKCQNPCDTTGLEPFATFSCPVCGNQMRVPARFANFIVLDQLGKGGMGAVYRAYDETLGRAVALKVMQQSIGQDRDFVGQFLQEARALAAINHPNIVQIYNYGEENGQPYIVMELVDGDRLDHIHAKKKSLDELEVLRIGIEVAQGMQAASAAGMTHGDIKPANILFDKAGRAKVTDFGLARLKGERPKPGEIWGTPYYVAPEVVRREAPNAASDIYSLGGTLYHLLTGEPPFNGETVTDTVLLRFKEPAPDPREFKPGITEATARILLRMLEADSFARYPNYQSLLNDLQQAYDALKDARSGKKKKKPFPVVGLVLGILGLAVLGVGGLLGWQAMASSRAKEEAARQEKIRIEEGLRDGTLRKVFNGREWVVVPVRRGDDGAPAAKSRGGKRRGSSSAPAEEEEAAPLAAPAANATAFTAAASADATVRPAGSKADRDDKVLALCAGSGDASKAAMIYLQFSLPESLPLALRHAKLRLTAKTTTKKPGSAPYKVRLWALRQDSPLPLLPTDANAPGAIAGRPSEVNGEAAEFIGEFSIKANPETGDAVEFESPELLSFVQNYEGRLLTLVLTGDTDTDHRGGWRFTSAEDAARFSPPTLSLTP